VPFGKGPLSQRGKQSVNKSEGRTFFHEGAARNFINSIVTAIVTADQA